MPLYDSPALDPVHSTVRLGGMAYATPNGLQVWVWGASGHWAPCPLLRCAPGCICLAVRPAVKPDILPACQHGMLSLTPAPSLPQAVITCDAAVDSELWRCMFERAVANSFAQVAMGEEAPRSGELLCLLGV